MSGARRPASPRAGFSLVEVLVALALFALAASMAWTGLASASRNQARLAAAQARFATVQRGVDFLARDLATAVDRPVRAQNGREAALQGDARRLAFTRAGAASMLQPAASDLQRVTWFLDGDTLVRGRYLALDRRDAGSLQRRELAPAVRAFTLRYLDRAGAWHDRWPPGSGRDTPEPLPRAVEYHIDFEDLGEIRRLIELAAAAPLPRRPAGDAP